MGYLGDLVAQADVEAALLRPLTTNEETYLAQVIWQATAKLQTALPTLSTRMAAWGQDPRPTSAINPDTVAAVLAGIIKRAFINPKGLSSRTETAGPFSESETYPGARGGEAASEVPGGLVVTPGDLAQLTATVQRARPRSARLRAGLAPRKHRGLMPSLVGFPVAVKRSAGTDRFGNPLPASEHTVENCVAAPAGSTELVNGQTTVIDKDTLYAAYDADVDSQDNVTVPAGQAITAGSYVVQGTPQRWKSAFGGDAFGCVIRLERVTG